MSRVQFHDSADSRERFDRIVMELSSLKNTEPLYEAFEYALSLYDDRLHWTSAGLLMDHVLNSLEQLSAFNPDKDSVIACLLSYALSIDSDVAEKIEQQFGSDVRSIVGSIHVLLHMTDGDNRLSLSTMRRMLSSRSGSDVRVVYILLCDRTAAIEHLSYVPPEMRRQFCRDALLLYAPVATRFGAYSLKHVLESRAFPVVHPNDAMRIAEQFARLHEQHGYFLDEAASALAQFLKAEGVEAEVHGRQKQPYSIFRKMQQKNVNHIEDIYDLFALRVIVKDQTQCYQVLGLLHRIGHPVAHRFKDYISFPKPNGYQSLHTTLAQLPWMPDNLMLEVQIRTREMHHDADVGIAAHWMYKTDDISATPRPMVEQLLSASEEEDREGEQMFVLTPQGDIVELPEGSSPLDFAFRVHTDLGLSYKSARVNGIAVPLDYQLENGDRVEILRSSTPQPSTRWMSVLKTASARRSLRQYLAEKERPHYVARGRELLNEHLRQLRYAPLDPKLSLLKSVDGQELSVQQREDLLAKLGQGAQNVSSFVRHIDALEMPAEQPSHVQKVPLSQIDAPLSAVELDDSIPMPMVFARCCQPEHGERSPIVGVINRDGQVRIHRQYCVLLKQVNPERLVEASWSSAVEKVRG